MAGPDQLEHHLLAQGQKTQSFFWHRLRNHIVYNALPKTRPLKVVDVGAGAGIFGDYLKLNDQNVSYSFVEPLESLNADLRRRHGATADASSASDFHAYDAVTLLDVLEHQKDDHVFMRDLVAKCKPQTEIVVTVPALPFLWSIWDKKLGHERRYTRKALLKTVAGLAVEVVECGYIFPEMVLPGWLRTFSGEEASSEFPDLPGWLNSILYYQGRSIYALRSFIPVGSSLLMVLRTKFQSFQGD
jgi:hypothetical protein